jgi:LysM repeat protein
MTCFEDTILMRQRRGLPLLIGLMALLLVGCFQNADTSDSFEPVDSNNAQPTQTPQAAPTETVMIIDPSAGEDDTATPQRAAPTATDDDVATATTLPPTNTAQAITPTATIRIINPTATSTRRAVPTSDTSDSTVPTATEASFVTPGADTVRDFPTGTPTPGPLPGSEDETGDSMSTPTALPGTEGGACEYIVSSGDNLFRIALNNDITLSALLEANNLAEGAIIQPGDRLVIPGCEEGPDDTIEDTPVEATATESGTALPGDVVEHTVASGETLFTIARRYGVTITDIVEANDLTDPDNLSIGQTLLIPNQ